MATTFKKDPDAILDYGVDWSSWLQTGEAITTSTWIVEGDITVGDGSNGAPVPSKTTTATTVWLLGGTPGLFYEVTNRIVTDQGRTDDRTITIEVVER